MSICKAEQSIWRNLKGLNKVVSQPDIRLYKYGVTTKSSRDAKTVVSVVEVKKNRRHRESDSSDSEGERCRSIGSFSSVSSRSSHTAEGKPRIAWLLNREVLGQHAGELLLDMHKFGQKSEDTTVYTMPGVIVKDTEANDMTPDSNLDKDSETSDYVKWEENSYYAVGTWYPGLVMEIQGDTKECAMLKYLHPCGEHFKWPTKDDNALTYARAILCKINIQAIGNGRLWSVEDKTKHR